MSFTLRWVGASDQELDLVAETRMRCYAHAAKDLDRYKEGIRADPRGVAGDFLIAEQDGVAVGTATAHSLTMWMRGAALGCQGVAYVGTIKTHRRGSSSRSAGEVLSSSKGAGIATRLMHETLRLARERGEVLSALMPFRASFYEHFGYGLVERRCDWAVPLAVLPAGAFEGVHFYEPADLPELRLCRQRMAERGQCDVERSAAVWDWTIKKSEDGFVVVDRPTPNGPVHGWAYFRHAFEHGKDLLRVAEIGYDDTPALLRLLHFLASLRDQYGVALLTLPAGVQLNRLLRETQVPHRPVNHPTADCRMHTRMQLRILDPKRLIEAMRLPQHTRGAVSAAVKECDEGESRGPHLSRFRLEISEGRGEVTMGAATEGASFECADTTWAAVVSGDLPATAAVHMGLAKADAPGAALLDAFAQGPAPACGEYF
jgi:predicted acetyltransferase